MIQRNVKPSLIRAALAAITLLGWATLLALTSVTQAAPLRIMPLGDSITAGYTDNPNWNVPFEFGYRSRLYTLLTNAGYDFVFVGGSLEPFNNLYGDPTKGGTVSPTLDLRTLGQNGHRGYGGKDAVYLNTNIASYLTADTPDVILLMIGINGISTSSPGWLDTLVGSIFTNKPTVKLVTAQIIPKIPYTSLVVDYNTYIRNTLLPKYTGQGRAITTVDQYANFLTNPADNTSINTALYSNAINHPTATGYNAMADTWFKGVLAVIPPTLPVLDQTQFASTIAPATTIGNFAQPPSPCTETLAFSLISGTGDTDNAKFAISGNQLRSGNYDFSHEPIGKTYFIRVRATGVTGGLIGERVFALSIPDTDADQLPDSWEMAKAGNLTSLNASGDFDHDGLTDAQEYALSLGSYPDIDPTKYDTDTDGLSDGEEINGSAPRPPTNPTKTDTDNDSICDACEDNTGVYVSLLKTGTNPTLADTDSDGRLDGSELLDGSNPLSSSSPAAPVVTTGSSTTSTFYNTSASNSDLLQGLTGVHTGWLTGTANNSASPTYLNDGVHGDDLYPPVKGGWSAGSGTVTSVYTLPVGTGNGWDITGITTIAAWTGGGFGNQKYTVSVRKVGETAFTSLASVDHHPFTATSSGGSRVQISHPTGKLASRVDAIQFTMLAIPTTYSNGGRAVYREFDVFGTASSAVVIPAAKVLAIGSPSIGAPRSSVIWSSYPGKTYRVETSENLSSWTVLSNAFPSGGLTTRYQQEFTSAAPVRAFYRITANP